MASLTDQIKLALESTMTLPWLPELTDEISKAGWDRLFCDSGLTITDYGTVRGIHKDATAPRRIIAYITTSQDADEFKTTIPLEILTGEIMARYEKAGVSFYTSEEIAGTPILSCIEDAMRILKLSPGLMSTVAALVRALHIIKPTDDERDVSFSEPHIPFSIFVSVPEKRMRADALRVAEAILHEAMHLQLTLIEQISPLVAVSRDKYFSPWRGEYRTAQGILHALYVFRVIDCFFGELLSDSAILEEYSDYMQGRRHQIAKQIRQVKSFQDCPELTSMGATFVRRILDPYIS